MDNDERQLYTLLLEDHPHLEGLYAQVLAACEANAPELGSLWTELETSLTRHLAAEEVHAFPEFAEIEPEEARVLRAQHDDIRARLTELGVCVDLHTIREDVAQAFIDTLRLHGQREDVLFHRWLEKKIEALET